LSQHGSVINIATNVLVISALSIIVYYSHTFWYRFSCARWTQLRTCRWNFCLLMSRFLKYYTVVYLKFCTM